MRICSTLHGTGLEVVSDEAIDFNESIDQLLGVLLGVGVRLRAMGLVAVPASAS
jgi:hypothetical protein